MLRIPHRPLLYALVALALAPAAASAGSVGYDGDTLVFRAAPGAANSVTLSGDEDGRISLSDSGDVPAGFPADRCTRLSEDHPLHCDLPARVRVELGDGDDRSVVDHTVPAGLEVLVSGDAGRDQLKVIADRTRTTLDGGAGNDEIRSEGGPDALLGGPGDDELLGQGGNDLLRGGDGDDLLRPDAGANEPGSDVVDGGAGTDTVDDWVSAERGAQKPVSVTLDGQANDGRPGENDDVLDIERVRAYAAGTYVMSDAADQVEVYAPTDFGASTVLGRGGDDRLTGGNAEQTFDGGAGADRIEGGFGNDTLIGGPGRDAIFGDSTQSQCGVLQSCTLPFGNDAIDARDGEADTVSCGVGTDTVAADAADTVADDCEAVDRSGAKPADPAGPGPATGLPNPDAAPGRLATLRVPAGQRLRTALRRGLKLKVSGLPAGPFTAKALRGRTTVGTGAAKVAADGRTAAVTIRFTKRARRSLARRRSVTLTVVIGSQRIPLTVRR